MTSPLRPQDRSRETRLGTMPRILRLSVFQCTTRGALKLRVLVTITMPVDVQGEWWLPGLGEARFDGTLSLPDAARPKLELKLRPGEAIKFDRRMMVMVLGTAKDDSSYTLEGCFPEVSHSFILASGHTEALHAAPLRVYRGVSREDIHEMPVRGVSFEMDYLCDYLGYPAGYRPNDDAPLPEHRHFILENRGTISFSCVQGEARRDGSEGWWSTRAMVRMEWERPRSLRKAEHEAHDLRFLLGLGMGRSPRLRNLVFVGENGSTVEDILSRGDPKSDTRVRLPAPRGGAEADVLMADFPKTLKSWSKLRKSARPVTDIAFADIDERDGRMPVPFLSLATGLEGYHRLQIARTQRRGPNLARDPEKRALQSVEDTWTLESRLRDLFGQLEPDIGGEFPDGSELAERVAQVRNYYAHYFKDASEKKPRSLEELHGLSRFARVLLVGHLMRELDLAPHAIREMAAYWAGFETHILAGYEP